MTLTGVRSSLAASILTGVLSGWAASTRSCAEATRADHGDRPSATNATAANRRRDMDNLSGLAETQRLSTNLCVSARPTRRADDSRRLQGQAAYHARRSRDRAEIRG